MSVLSTSTTTKLRGSGVRVEQTLKALEKAGSDSVVLADCCLSIKDVRILAQHIRKNKKLTSLDLRGNQLRGDAVVLIANAINETDNLRTLSMEWNSCGVFPDGIRALSNAISRHKSLNNLDLRNNRIGSDGAVSIASALRTNTSLLRVDLRWNGMGTSGSRALASALDDNKTLLNLEISGNGATEESLSKIHNALSRNRLNDSNKVSENEEDDKSITSEDDQNVLSAENKLDITMEEKVDTKNVVKTNKLQQRSYNQSLSQERREIEMAVPHSLQGAILCIRTLEDRLRISRAETREIGTKYDTEVRAHTRCKSHLEKMVSSLEKEKIEHKDTIEKYEGHIKLISEKLKDAEEQLRKEKETITNYELNSKKNTVELREAARHAESNLKDANAEIARNQTVRESLEKQLEELHAEISKNQSVLLAVEESKEKAVKAARSDEREAMRIQLKIAEDGRAHAEDRRKKMAEMHENLNKQLQEATTNYMNERLQHQKELELMQIRIREEVEAKTKSTLEQLEAQLKAVEVAHERLQNKNSEDSKRFADGQGRAAEQLANLQEALTEELDNGKQNKTLLYDAMEKERNFLEKIDMLEKNIQELYTDKENLNRRLNETSEKTKKDIEEINHKNGLERKTQLDIINTKIERITELEGMLKQKESDITNLTNMRNEHVGNIEVKVINEIRKVFNDSMAK